MATAYELLNLARVEAGYEDRIPEINQDNLHNLSLLPPEEMNDFLKVIVKVVRQYAYDTTFSVDDNPFAKFFGELLPTGYTVEDMYIDLITGSTPKWDDDGSYALSKKLPDTKSLYHSQNYEMQYKVSTSYAQMKSAFLTERAFDSVEARIRGTLDSSAQFDLYLNTLQLISTAIIRSAMRMEYGYDVESEAGIKKLLKRAKILSKEFQKMNTKYNYYHFNTKTKKSDIVILVKPSVLETINVDYLAGVFNLSLAEVNDMIIELPDDYGWGELDGEDSMIHPTMVIMDRRFLRIFPTFFEGSAIFNPASFVFNTFLTLQYIFSYSLFFNAVVLCADEEPEINIVNSNPDLNVYVNGTFVEQVTLTAIKNGDLVELISTVEGSNTVIITGLYDSATNSSNSFTVNLKGTGDTYSFIVTNNAYSPATISIGLQV